jgi:hypothetical protein
LSQAQPAIAASNVTLWTRVSRRYRKTAGDRRSTWRPDPLGWRKSRVTGGPTLFRSIMTLARESQTTHTRSKMKAENNRFRRDYPEPLQRCKDVGPGVASTAAIAVNRNPPHPIVAKSRDCSGKLRSMSALLRISAQSRRSRSFEQIWRARDCCSRALTRHEASARFRFSIASSISAGLL